MKTIIAIGGGEIKNKTTALIDEYIANLAKKHAGEKRANALFIGTASHDSMPYFNSFRKTYTSVHDIKAEVALMVYGEMNHDKIADKIKNADAIYVGGGDTLFMLDTWAKNEITGLIKEAYENGTVICGLSAGAICWFTDMYTDSDILNGGTDYKFEKGLGFIKGLCTPHYNERQKDFDQNFAKSDYKTAVAIENDCAVVFENGEIVKSISSGGNAYFITKSDGELIKTKI